MPKGNTALTAFKAGLKSKRTGEHHRPKMTISLALIAGLMPMVLDLKDAYKVDGLPAVASHVGLCTVGYDGVNKWNPGYAFRKLWAPLAMGFVAHKLASRLGINRMLGRMGIPLVRI
jgi:hypothetical protein